MVPRNDGRAQLVARIDAARCVSCGICAGSCAPMGVGPPGHTGRDQLAGVRALIAGGTVQGRLVAFACHHGAATVRPTLEGLGVEVIPVECVGNLHTSAIEFVVRAGARCALVLTCPPRDCWSREGPRWLGERIYAEREAELQERVDRRRVRIEEVAAHEPAAVRAIVARLETELAALGQPAPEAAIELETECEAPPLPEEARP